MEIDEEQVNTKEPRLKFRNYVPRSKELREYCIERPTIDDLEKKLEEDVQHVIDQSMKTVGRLI